MRRILPVRPLLLFALLALAGMAHAAGDAVHHSAGSNCPADAAAAGTDDETADGGAPGPTSQRDGVGSGDRALRSRAGGSERTRARLRWHAFVPGMFK